MMKNKKTARGKTLKGQALMEYFITYGVALLVILIVLGIIFALVLPMLKAPTTCKFSDPNFSCNQKEHVLVADSNNNVRILFQLNNVGSRSVDLFGVVCTTKTPGNIVKADVPGSDGSSKLATIGAAGSILGGTSSDPTDVVDCIKEDGTKVQLNPNSNFKGTLAIAYKYSEDIPTAPMRLATATLVGTVQAE